MTSDLLSQNTKKNKKNGSDGFYFQNVFCKVSFAKIYLISFSIYCNSNNDI